jgi:hypothetical protein
VIAIPFHFGSGESGFLKAYSAGSVVQKPVMQGVVRRPVVLIARYGQPSPVLGVISDQGPLCRVCYHAGVVGACEWRANDGDRVAEHVVPADRFAREIVGFWEVFSCALAAAEL